VYSGGAYTCRSARAPRCKVYGHDGAKTATITILLLYVFILCTINYCYYDGRVRVHKHTHTMNAPPPQRVVQHATAHNDIVRIIIIYMYMQN